jgi:ABC-type Fe3+-hydroxamate transport system substrate-binding protein
MMKFCGLQNIYADKTRYPEITLRELQSANCQLVLLSSEPYPFKQKDVDELQKVLPGKKIILADGEMFSWYGSRLVEAPQYFKELLNVNGQ